MHWWVVRLKWLGGGWCGCLLLDGLLEGMVVGVVCALSWLLVTDVVGFVGACGTLVGMLAMLGRGVSRGAIGGFVVADGCEGRGGCRED